MQFTPVTALLGGLTLGIVSLAKFAITGRILGISGALKGFVQGSITPWRVLFTAGMLVGAWLAKGMVPHAFDAIPSTFTVRAARQLQQVVSQQLGQVVLMAIQQGSAQNSSKSDSRLSCCNIAPHDSADIGSTLRSSSRAPGQQQHVATGQQQQQQRQKQQQKQQQLKQQQPHTHIAGYACTTVCFSGCC